MLYPDSRYGRDFSDPPYGKQQQQGIFPSDSVDLRMHQVLLVHGQKPLTVGPLDLDQRSFHQPSLF